MATLAALVLQEAAEREQRNGRGLIAATNGPGAGAETTSVPVVESTTGPESEGHVRSEEAEQAPEAKAAQEVAAAQADADADAAEGRAGAEAAEDTDDDGGRCNARGERHARRGYHQPGAEKERSKDLEGVAAEKSCTAFDKPIEVFNEGCTERRRISRQRVAFAHG